MSFDDSHNNISAEAYEKIFNSLETAVIYYNAQGELSAANDVSWRVLPMLRSHLSYFTDFIRFVYDHSIDSEDQNGLTPSSVSQDNSLAFYEVIRLCPDKFYLVRAIEQSHKGMIVELSDISLIKTHADDMRVLDGNNKILIEAMQTSQKGIFIAEHGGQRRIIFANKALDKLLERETIPLEGYSVDALLSSHFQDEWSKIQSTILNRHKGSFWKRIEREGGNPKWISLNLSADSCCGGQNLIIGFMCDESQAKLQENHLRQTQKLEAIGKLAGGVAHDFNNILSIVEGYIRLSESALKRGEPIHENIARIKQAVARGSGLTKQLLMFGKHRVADSRVIDLCAQTREMESLLCPLLGEGIYLNIDVPDSVFPVKVTPDTVSQIVMNLVLNARDAMANGGDILVSVYQENTKGTDYAVLRVTDTGKGISPEIMEKIFDPFFTTKEQGKGTGLGLSMVYGLVQQIGGEIDVVSVINEGTNFTIHIPFADEIHLSDIEKIPDHSADHITGKTILIAEDEPDLLAIMRETLKDFQLNVLTAKNGNEALMVQDEYDGKIDFLLTDMVMPQLGGLKLAELIGEVRPETKVLYMSGYPVRGEIASIDLPSDAIFMAKPIKPDSLRNVLEQMASGKPVNHNEATTWQS